VSQVLVLTEDSAEIRDTVVALAEARGAVGLVALGRRLVCVDGMDGAVAALPGVVSILEEFAGAAVPAAGLSDDPDSARLVIGGLLGLDGSTVDDETLGDVLGWGDMVGAEFAALTAQPLGDGQPWPFEGGCLDPVPAPVPPPGSPLRAARFAGDPVLEECLANTHRMMAPEQGVAVLKIQQALLDLGFPLPEHGADAIFGGETGAAVSQFKREQALDPDDPVVAHGTMQRLDDLFA